ncbi:MAG: hypothetical protein JEY96_19665 [Bacteroidales bacterium]|nr:hypothetical protein [Bacteroidales bacterium]
MKKKELIIMIIPFGLFLLFLPIPIELLYRQSIAESWGEIYAEIVTIDKNEYFTNGRSGTNVHYYYIVNIKYVYDGDEYYSSINTDDYIKKINNRIIIKIDESNPEDYIYGNIEMKYAYIFLFISLASLIGGIINIQFIFRKNKK